MIRSMTGFGHANRQVAGLNIQLDIKSVNHRFCDIVVKLPKDWLRMEDRIRKEVQSKVHRGRVEIYVSITTSFSEDHDQQTAKVNLSLARSYMNAALQLKKAFHLDGQVSLQELLQHPEIVILQELSDEMIDHVEEAIYQCTLEATDQLLSMRRAEGVNLQKELMNKLNQVTNIYNSMRKLAPMAVKEQQSKLRERITELINDVVELDESRIAMEAAILADRMNIDEELARFASHCDQFRKLLQASEPVGRKMDFLLQEMNREANTMGSKAQHLELQSCVIELKAELEKLREQVQNIE